MPKTGGYQRIVAMVGSSTKLEECTFGRCTRSAQKRSCSYFLRHCGHYWTHSIKCFSVSINFYNTIVSSLLFFLFFLLQYQTCRHPYVLPKYTCRDLLRISPPLVVWTLSFTMKCNLYYFLIRRILFIIISPSFFYMLIDGRRCCRKTTADQGMIKWRLYLIFWPAFAIVGGTILACRIP